MRMRDRERDAASGKRTDAGRRRWPRLKTAALDGVEEAESTEQLRNF